MKKKLVYDLIFAHQKLWYNDASLCYHENYTIIINLF